MWRRCAVLALCAAGAARGAHLIVGDTDAPPIWLSGGGDGGGMPRGHVWTATATKGPNAGISIPAVVPGDLLSDLERAGLIGDPLYMLNFLNSSLWANNTWQYSLSFELPEPHAEHYVLVFDGIKMAANIALNGVELGIANDQFLRYTFSLTPGALGSPLRAGANRLTVTFDPAADTDGRFMACTGGWDWAPYTTTYEASSGARTFSKGIWRHVLAVPVQSAAITDVVPQIMYLGDYPVEPLRDGAHGGFDVAVRVHLWAHADGSGTLSVRGGWSGAEASTSVELRAGENTVTLKLKATAQNILLWWPIGVGEQHLYSVSVAYKPAAAGAVAATADRRVGFRHFTLVTGNDTDPEWVAGAASKEGSGQLGMLFRVNGAAILSRGANMIPMEELEGRLRDDAHVALVRSAADAHMNTLRVWGGGIFLPDAWYDACDELGLLVFHDLQYAQQGHAPRSGAVQAAELRHQVRRLASHPSIVVWDGCNECQVYMDSDTGVYASFVMTVVAEEDVSRSVMPSCPSVGWESGVDMLTGRPNGGKLITPPKGARVPGSIERHGPYQHGSGFPAVNGGTKMQPFDANIPIRVAPPSQGNGIGRPNIFASEFGCVVMSSFESMSPTLSPQHWGLHAGMAPDTCTNVGGGRSQCVGDNVMAQRNYPCDSIIDVYFGQQDDFDDVGEAVFKKQLYQCMLGQALQVKADIETRRSQNQFGLIVWQLNEIWPTGGWGSVEYGTPRPGQVLGGRWKPLHYFYEASLFRDVMASCGVGGACYVANDAPFPFEGRVLISAVNFGTGLVTPVHDRNVSLAAGAGVVEFFDVGSLASVDGSKSIVTVAVFDRDGRAISNNVVALAPPLAMQLPRATVDFRVGDAPNEDGSVNIDVHSDKVALYVTFTTLANGRFSENAFLLVPTTTGPRTIRFIPFLGAAVDVALLKSSLRVEHLATYAKDAATAAEAPRLFV